VIFWSLKCVDIRFVNAKLSLLENGQIGNYKAGVVLNLNFMLLWQTKCSLL